MVGGRRVGRNDPSGSTGSACCQMDNLSLLECTAFHSRANVVCVLFYKELVGELQFGPRSLKCCKMLRLSLDRFQEATMLRLYFLRV